MRNCVFFSSLIRCMLYTVQNEKEEWDVDQRLIDRLKDQYKKERKGMKSSKSSLIHTRTHP